MVPLQPKMKGTEMALYGVYLIHPLWLVNQMCLVVVVVVMMMP